MKKLLFWLLLALSFTHASAAVDKISLGSGRSAVVSLPDTWVSGDPSPRLPDLPGTATARYVPKNGANEAVVITLLIMPNDLLADAESFEAAAEMAARRFARGSVEGKADFKEFKVGGRSGYFCVFTDAKLVGKPPVPDDYKTMTHCFVYLGDRVLLMASIFTDNPAGESYTAARKIIQSLTLSLPQNTI